MDWKRIGKKLLFPPVWILALLALFSAASLTAVFLNGWDTAPVAYGIYVLSFYTLCAVTAFCVRVLPGKLQSLRQRLFVTSLGNRYMTDRGFRDRLSLHISLAVNLGYVGLHALLWYLQRSWWFLVLAGYYGILSVMRFLLVGYVRKNTIGSSLLAEWKRSRSCAYLLLTVNLSLSGAVLMILYQNRGYHYPGILIYVMAAYTFYCVIHAIVDLVRYRSLGSPILSTAKAVSLSAALVSLLSLETAMFSQFGSDMAPEDRRLMIILTGAGVSIGVVTLATALIVRATKEIRSLKYGRKR